MMVTLQLNYLLIYQNDMEIKCIITDDEPIARNGIRRYVDKIDFLTIVGECEDAIQLNNMLRSVQPDLIFLDIEMPHLSGLDFLANARQVPKVIITSAYEQYALKGYEFDVVDYLLKPIPFARFLKAVNKAHALIEPEAKNGKDAYIFIKVEKMLKKILFRDIMFIESMENYIVIYTLDSKDIVNIRLKTILEALPENLFMQVHRSYIVNLSYIQAIEGNQLMIGEHKVPVARPLREEVYKAVLKNQIVQK